MIHLHGRVAERTLDGEVGRGVFRLVAAEMDGSGVFRLESPAAAEDGRKIYLAKESELLFGYSEWVLLPRELGYLKVGDIVHLSADGSYIHTLWRGNGTTNTLLLTERCDNYCLMCSQPPKDRNDDWLIEQALDVIDLLPLDADELGISGGEPTLYGERFVEVVRRFTSRLPSTSLHILSNGRAFADRPFSRAFAQSSNEKTMVGIPLYGSNYRLHDYVVQADGAFEETVQGILNLCELGQNVEIRVVLHKVTAPKIREIARFIVRNLPFVDQVALMGLEVMGLAKKNLDDLWIDPADYSAGLAEAVQLLDSHRVRVLVYNHQLCLVEPEIWPYTVRSISDWKNEYDPVCSQCDVQDLCGGFFHSAKFGSSSKIHPLTRDGLPKGPRRELSPSKEALETLPPGTWRRKSIPVSSD